MPPAGSSRLQPNPIQPLTSSVVSSHSLALSCLSPRTRPPRTQTACACHLHKIIIITTTRLLYTRHLPSRHTITPFPEKKKKKERRGIKNLKKNPTPLHSQSLRPPSWSKSIHPHLSYTRTPFSYLSSPFLPNSRATTTRERQFPKSTPLSLPIQRPTSPFRIHRPAPFPLYFNRRNAASHTSLAPSLRPPLPYPDPGKP